MNDDFRPFVPAAGSGPASDTTDRAHAESVQKRPRAKALWEQWADLAAQPFIGIPTGGDCKSDLYALGDNGAPTVQTKAAWSPTRPRSTPAARSNSGFRRGHGIPPAK